jgi:hypothetical protein
MLGRLGNNMFEIAFANQLAGKLCWPIIYRKSWEPAFPSEKTIKCFPNALQRANSADLEYIRGFFNMSDEVWDALTFTSVELNLLAAKTVYQNWLSDLEEKTDLVYRCRHLQCNFTGTFVDELVESVHSSNVRLIDLDAFFIHYNWIQLKSFQHWFEVDPSCCHRRPPKDSIVIHFRNFREGDHGIKNVPWNETVYQEIISHYGYQDRSVWVVCEQRSVQSHLVQRLAQTLNASIYTGDDPIDAHCFLQQADILVLSSCSTFSQSAALLANAQQVHYPTYSWRYPKVTLLVPEWKYHLVDHPHESSKHKIIEFDMDHSKMRVRFADA